MTQRHSMTRRGTVRGAERAVPEDTGRPAPRWPAVLLRVAGSGLLIATAAIHLDLYLTGYRTIPTIGWLFLLQVIAAFGLGLAVLAIPRRLVAGEPAGRRGGAGFALATLGGYLLSVWTGLFGFKEVRTGPASPPGWSRWPPSQSWPRSRLLPPRRTPRRAARQRRGPVPRPDPSGGRPGGRGDRRGPGGCRAGPVRAGGRRGQLCAARSRGHDPDDHDDRRDHGTDQRQRLHPLLLRPRHPSHIQVLWQLRGVLAPGDRHHRGRAGPARQGHHHHPYRRLTPAHHNGHPLYTYIGDTAPGQARGNNLNLNGGLWHEVPASR